MVAHKCCGVARDGQRRFGRGEKFAVLAGLV